MSDGLSINWGAFNQSIQSNNIGNAFQEGYDRGQQMQAKRLTGEAMQALIADPNGGQDQINALARIAPAQAQALLSFRHQQQERQRDTQFRDAASRYFTAGGGGVLNALMPPSSGQGALGALSAPGGVPPISAAPPPPTDWQQTLGPGAVNALGALGAPAALPSEPSTPPPSPIRPIDPNTAIPNIGGMMSADPYASRGIGAESGVTGQYAPDGAAGVPALAAPAPQAALAPNSGDGQPTADTFEDMPASIRNRANSPNMEARNAAFAEMVKIDVVRAMKIDSEFRDQTLDRLEDAHKAYQFAVARLPGVKDEASYQRVLGEVDRFLAPLGVNIRDTVPPNYPGPEGTRQLLMQAMDAQQQLAAMDRRFSAEANKADDEADNDRADRDVDSKIADRNARTDIQRQRAGTADRREARIAAGGGRGGKGSGGKGAKVRPGEQVAKGPNGERMVVRGGKWVPAQ
jgi:hypothetical protein